MPESGQPQRPTLRTHERQACSDSSAPSRARPPAWPGGWPSTWRTARAAAAYFRAGVEAAQEANDRALGAYLVGSSCVQPAYRERPQARLRRLQGQTFGFQTFDANPSTRAWLITLEAEAHALAGTSAPP